MLSFVSRRRHARLVSSVGSRSATRLAAIAAALGHKPFAAFLEVEEADALGRVAQENSACAVDGMSRRYIE